MPAFGMDRFAGEEAVCPTGAVFNYSRELFEEFAKEVRFLCSILPSGRAMLADSSTFACHV